MNSILQKFNIVVMTVFLFSAIASGQNFGSSLQFDGSNDRVEIPNNTNFLEPSDLTLEVWVKKGRISSPWGKDRIMISVANNGWGLGFNGTNKIFFTKTGVSEVGMDTAITDTTWHHVAVTHDGTTTTFYLDGQLQSVKPNAVVYNSSGNYTIASRGNNEFFQGEIDEIRIWNTIRTQTEIANNMCSLLPGSETGLIAYYNFNDAAGDSLTDIASANNGFLVNMDTAVSWVQSTVPCTTSVAVYENRSNNNLAIYPNPNNGRFVISQSSLVNSKVEIYNILGEKVYQSQVTNDLMTIDLSGNSPGIYFVQVKNENVIIATQKIVIQ